MRRVVVMVNMMTIIKLFFIAVETRAVEIDEPRQTRVVKSGEPKYEFHICCDALAMTGCGKVGGRTRGWAHGTLVRWCHRPGLLERRRGGRELGGRGARACARRTGQLNYTHGRLEGDL